MGGFSFTSFSLAVKENEGIKFLKMSICYPTDFVDDPILIARKVKNRLYTETIYIIAKEERLMKISEIKTESYTTKAKILVCRIITGVSCRHFIQTF